MDPDLFLQIPRHHSLNSTHFGARLPVPVPLPPLRHPIRFMTLDPRQLTSSKLLCRQIPANLRIPQLLFSFLPFPLVAVFDFAHLADHSALCADAGAVDVEEDGDGNDDNLENTEDRSCFVRSQCVVKGGPSQRQCSPSQAIGQSVCCQDWGCSRAREIYLRTTALPATFDHSQPL